jgi:hypothetical protein
MNAETWNIFIIAGSTFNILNNILPNKTPIIKSSYLFVCSLFNAAIGNSVYIAFKEWLCREAIVAYFENQSQHCLVGNHKNPQSG